MTIKEIRVSLTIDGDRWSALIGPNLMEGIPGFGSTPALALKALAEEIGVVGDQQAFLDQWGVIVASVWPVSR